MSNEQANKITLANNIHWAFATPIIAFQWPDSDALNDELTALILDREKQDQSKVQLSNAGGWQSSDDLLMWGGTAVGELKRRIDALLFATLKETSATPNDPPKTQFRIDCWANVNRAGDYNVVHNHPNALWSGVYYVSAGKPNPNVPQAGKIELLDPREAANFVQVNQTIMDQKCFLKNDPGLMILFPSWLKHMVHPHQGDGTRISIAFNALPAFR